MTNEPREALRMELKERGCDINEREFNAIWKASREEARKEIRKEIKIKQRTSTYTADWLDGYNERAEEILESLRNPHTQ